MTQILRSDSVVVVTIIIRLTAKVQLPAALYYSANIHIDCHGSNHIQIIHIQHVLTKS